MQIYRIFIRIISIFFFNKAKRKAFRSKYINQKPRITCPIFYFNHNKLIIVNEDGTEKVNPLFGVPGLKIRWGGKNSVCKIHKPYYFDNCYIPFGNNNFVEIKSSCYPVLNLTVSRFLKLRRKMSDSCRLIIGKNFSCGETLIVLNNEPGNQVIIGDDCMFSFGIVLWPSDGHTIYDNETKHVLNIPKKGITIGNHCWIGRNVSFLKDSGVSDNVVVGSCAVVTKQHAEQNCIIAGIPAKVIKKGINWDRKCSCRYQSELTDNE